MDGISLDEARHLAWLVSRHQANYTPFVEHLDEFALYRSLENLEQVLAKLNARDLHDRGVPHVRTLCTPQTHTSSARNGRTTRAWPVSARLLRMAMLCSTTIVQNTSGRYHADKPTSEHSAHKPGLAPSCVNQSTSRLAWTKTRTPFPFKQRCVLVVDVNKVVNRLSKLARRSEAGAPQSLPTQDAEPALHLILPRGAGRDEVEMNVGVPLPTAILFRFVGAEVSSTTWISRPGWGATISFMKSRNSRLRRRR